jgi:hypothetical protein
VTSSPLKKPKTKRMPLLTPTNSAPPRREPRRSSVRSSSASKTCGLTPFLQRQVLTRIHSHDTVLYSSHFSKILDCCQRRVMKGTSIERRHSRTDPGGRRTLFSQAVMSVGESHETFQLHGRAATDPKTASKKRTQGRSELREQWTHYFAGLADSVVQKVDERYIRIYTLLHTAMYVVR